MTLTLHLHPLSSYCHKPLIALYENATPFKSNTVDLGDPVAREGLKQLWPITKFPVLCDDERGRTVPESTVIIEYLARFYPGPTQLIPQDPELAFQVRSADRFYDLHVHEQMGKIVGDKLRPADGHDPIGVEQAWDRVHTALGMAERDMATRRWAVGDQFSMADCAAGPPLFYINKMRPLAAPFPHLNAYLERLVQRPSYARVLLEAQPYMHMFPG